MLRVALGNRSRAIDSGIIRQPIGRAADAPAPTIEDVRVDHRRCHVVVAEQFLHRANVISILKQMSRKRVPERVARGVLADPRSNDRVSDSPLNDRLMQMMAK